MSSLVMEMRLPEKPRSGNPAPDPAVTAATKEGARTMAPTLAQACAAARLAGRAADATGQAQATGRSEGGKVERPSHASYYSPLPVGGIAMPKRDERSADIDQQEEVRRRVRRRSI